MFHVFAVLITAVSLGVDLVGGVVYVRILEILCNKSFASDSCITFYLKLRRKWSITFLLLEEALN